MESINDILKERGERYGSFIGHAILTQSIKDTMRESSNWDIMYNYQKEALEMIAHKIGRIVNGDADYVDSWRDIEGYAKLVADLLEQQ